MNAGRAWGSTETERAAAYPCDEQLPEIRDAYFRAVDVDAPPALVYRWLCQISVAPYSYDWIDNRGRRSPQTLTPGADELELGDRIAGLFELVDFEPGRQLTLKMVGSFLLPFTRGCAITYQVNERPGGGSRLVAKLVLGARRGGPIPWLELVMMRKQLLNWRDLAERDAR